MQPINQIARRETPYPYNGWENAAGLYQRSDIAQPGVEANVYDFVHDKVEPLPWNRRDSAYPANGWTDKNPAALS